MPRKAREEWDVDPKKWQPGSEIVDSEIRCGFSSSPTRGGGRFGQARGLRTSPERRGRPDRNVFCCFLLIPYTHARTHARTHASKQASTHAPPPHTHTHCLTCSIQGLFCKNTSVVLRACRQPGIPFTCPGFCIHLYKSL